MQALNYTIDIKAPKEKVWHTMLDLETYKQWSSVFHKGSTYIGSWDKGSIIRFVSEGDGGKSGILGKIVENTPYEFISIESIAEIVDGKEDTTSESAQKWIGTHENYRFTENNGVTTVDVKLVGEGMDEKVTAMFEGMWPNALAELKEITEQA